MKTAENPPEIAKSRRPAEYSSFDFVQAVCCFAGLVGVRYRSLCVQRFSFQHFSFTQIPLFPRNPLFPASGPATGSFNGPHLKSKFLSNPKAIP